MRVDHEHEAEDSGNLKKTLIFGGVIVAIGLLFFGGVVVAIVLKGGGSEENSRYPTTRPAMYYPMAATKLEDAIIDADLTKEDVGLDKDLNTRLEVKREEDVNVASPRIETTIDPTAVTEVKFPVGPVVTSVPPLVVPGTNFQYQITTRSKVGISEYIFLSGPKGMSVSKTGLVTWQVNADYKGTETGSVSVVDKTGRFHYHTFKLEIR